MYELAKSEEFQESIINTLMDDFCEEAMRSISIRRDIKYIRELTMYNKGLEIKVSLPDIVEYLKSLIEHILRNKKVTLMLLESINKPLGSTSQELLYYLRPNVD